MSFWYPISSFRISHPSLHSISTLKSKETNRLIFDIWNNSPHFKILYCVSQNIAEGGNPRHIIYLRRVYWQVIYKFESLIQQYLFWLMVKRILNYNIYIYIGKASWISNVIGFGLQEETNKVINLIELDYETRHLNISSNWNYVYELLTWFCIHIYLSII